MGAEQGVRDVLFVFLNMIFWENNVQVHMTYGGFELFNSSTFRHINVGKDWTKFYRDAQVNSRPLEP